MKILRQHYILILIIVLAAFLRFYNLSAVPPGLTWDEAALGYNAYSLLQSGRDEYGNFFPLNLESFGDYKPALYAYLTIPFIAVLGLNEVAVRLPSAIFGIGLVFIIYLLIQQLFKNRTLAYLSALMLAISPLAIQFSRPAFESGVALFFITSAVCLFLKSLDSQKYLVPSVLLFSLSLFTYQAARLFVPILIIGLVVIFLKQIKFGKTFKIGMLIFSSSLVITYLFLFGLGQSKRLETMNFFAYSRSEEQISQIIKEDNSDGENLTFQILHGEWFAYTRGLFERYLTYFSPNVLFIKGDPSPRHGVPDMGILFYISILLIPLGIFHLLSQYLKNSSVIFLWLLLAPIPAVLSRDLISMIRALNMLIPLAVLEGAGLYYLVSLLKTKGKLGFRVGLVALSIFILANLGIFIDRYFIHMPKEYSQGWVFGYKEVMQEVKELQQVKKYDRIVISDKYGQPYIYYLFHTNYAAANFQKQAVLDQPSVDVGTVRKVDNIEFKSIYWPAERGKKNTLFVGTLEELPDQDIKPFSEYKILREINFLDNTPAWRIVETAN